jgi:hypothetical protein
MSSILFRDISEINNFRYRPYKYKNEPSWETANYIGVPEMQKYIDEHPAVFKCFSHIVCSDGTESGYGIYENEQSTGGNVFCASPFLLEAADAGVLKDIGGENGKLFVAGDDHHLSTQTNSLKNLTNHYTGIYHEAKNCRCSFVKSFPMGSIMAYTLTNGGNKILPYLNEPRKKQKLIASAFGYRYAFLTDIIDQRAALQKFLESPKASHIDVFECPPEDYYSELSQYKFFICPIGNGIQTPKLQESLLTYTIPVVKKHVVYQDLVEWGLPLLVVDNWRDISEKLLNDYYDEVYPTIDWDAVRSLYHSDFFKKVYLS